MVITKALHDKYYWQFSIRFERQDYQKELFRLLRKETSNMQLPGFRPNKTPLQLLERKFGAAAKKEILTKKLEIVLIQQFQNLMAQGVKDETLNLDGSIYTEEWLKEQDKPEIKAENENFETIGDFVFLKNNTQDTQYNRNDYEAVIAGLLIPKDLRLDLKQYSIDAYELDFDPQFIDANLAAFQAFYGNEERSIKADECLETLQKERAGKVIICDVMQTSYATQNLCDILIINQLSDELKKQINAKFKLSRGEQFDLDIDKTLLEPHFLITDSKNILPKVRVSLDNFRLVSPQEFSPDFFKNVSQYLDNRFTDLEQPNFETVKIQLEDQKTISDKIDQPESNPKEIIEKLKSDWEDWQKYVQSLAQTDSNRAILTDVKTTLANLKKDIAKLQKEQEPQSDEEAETESKEELEITKEDFQVLTDQIESLYDNLEKVHAETLNLESIKSKLKEAIDFQYKSFLNKLTVLQAVKELSQAIPLPFPADYVTASQQKVEQEANQPYLDYQHSFRVQQNLKFLTTLLENHYELEQYAAVLERNIRTNFQNSSLDEELFERYREEVLKSPNNYYAKLAQQEHFEKLAATLKANMSQSTKKLTSPQAAYAILNELDEVQRSIFSGDYSNPEAEMASENTPENLDQNNS